MNPARKRNRIRLPRLAVAVWRSLSICGSRADRFPDDVLAVLAATGACEVDADEAGQLWYRRAECTVVAM